MKFLNLSRQKLEKLTRAINNIRMIIQQTESLVCKTINLTLTGAYVKGGMAVAIKL
jgi:hypothetical protein